MKSAAALLGITLIRLFALLPLAGMQRLGALIGWLVWRHQGKSRRICSRNIERCYPELTAEQQQRLVKQSLMEFGKSLAELGLTWGSSPKRGLKKVRQVHNEARLEEALAADRPVLVLTPHLANWEVVGLYLTNRTPCTIMYRPNRNARFSRWMEQRREAFGENQMAPANKKGVAMAVKRLKSGGVLAILPDQEPDPPGGLFAPFFDQQAYTMSLGSQLRQRADARGLLITCARLPRGQGFDIYIEEMDEAFYSADLATSVAGLNASLERAIRQIPEQYNWAYKRFEHRPEGQPRFY